MKHLITFSVDITTFYFFIFFIFCLVPVIFVFRWRLECSLSYLMVKVTANWNATSVSAFYFHRCASFSPRASGESHSRDVVRTHTFRIGWKWKVNSKLRGERNPKQIWLKNEIKDNKFRTMNLNIKIREGVRVEKWMNSNVQNVFHKNEPLKSQPLGHKSVYGGGS
jgi:hypothetical protein